jgi:hypothetical protein
MTHTNPRPWQPLFWLCPLVFLSLSCTTVPEVRKAEVVDELSLDRPPSSGPLYSWEGESLTGPVTVRISLAEQKAYFIRGGQPAGWSYVATGKSSHPTPTGSYYITEKVVKKSSNRYGETINGRFVGAPMPYWMRLTSYGIGMHGGPIPSPGSTASHGCIRFPYSMARILYGYVKIGTPVRIYR